MKVFLAVVCLLLTASLGMQAQDSPSSTSNVQEHPPQPAAAAKSQPEIDPVKALPPGEYREKLIDLFFAKFHSKADPHFITKLAIPVYDKYYSDQEIKGLIEFYSTPLGQKTLSVLPKVVAELQEGGGKWGEELGRDSMVEVLSEHPDLASALEAARKAQNTQSQ